MAIPAFLLPALMAATTSAATMPSSSHVHAEPAARPEPASTAPPAAITRFKCQDGGELQAQFVSRDARLFAIVDSGGDRHALPITPWTGGPAKLTWTDGRHTLTWSPGVQIMWMDGAAHRMCGRGGHEH